MQSPRHPCQFQWVATASFFSLLFFNPTSFVFVNSILKNAVHAAATLTTEAMPDTKADIQLYRESKIMYRCSILSIKRFSSIPAEALLPKPLIDTPILLASRLSAASLSLILLIFIIFFNFFMAWFFASMFLPCLPLIHFQRL